MACLQIYGELLLIATFLWVHSNSKEVSYLTWQNTYPNLKTFGHIKLKLFLWTKLLENLLFTKYFISVTAPLNVFQVVKTCLLFNPLYISKTKYCLIKGLLIPSFGIKRPFIRQYFIYTSILPFNKSQFFTLTHCKSIGFTFFCLCKARIFKFIFFYALNNAITLLLQIN